MAELPYMSVPVADAIADAEGLTNEQLGALERVRRVLWRKITPDTVAPSMDLDEVIRVSRLGKRWGKAGPGLMVRLMWVEGRLSCPVITDLLARTRRRRSQRVGAALASAAIRASEGARNRSSEGARKPRNPLECHDVDADLVGPPLIRGGHNHNQKSRPDHENTPGMSPGMSTKRLVEQQEALYREGVTLLMEKTGVTRLQAQKNISAWLGMLNGDADGVAKLLADADTENLTGRTFSLMVARRAETIERERTKGLSLPLGPTPIKAAGGGRC